MPARTRTRTRTRTRAADSKMHRIVAVELAASCNGAQAGRALPSHVIAGQGHRLVTLSRSLSLALSTPHPPLPPSIPLPLSPHTHAHSFTVRLSLCANAYMHRGFKEGNDALFNGPRGLVLSPDGRLFIADSGLGFRV
jgi:hypothetical protein